MTNQISSTDYEIAAQFAHFFTAAFLVSQIGRFGLKWLLVAAVSMIAFAAVKEFWFDAKGGDKLTLLDFSMYSAGVATAVGLWFV